jgi:dihydroorotate dehydrogenase electron transfer subunit
MFRERCKVLDNKKIAPGHYVLKFSSSRIAKNAAPGQFVQILCSDSFEPLLPRPFSFLTVSRKDLSVLYQTVGQGTRLLSQIAKGKELWIIGPLGNGFSKKAAEEDLVLVGGGVGIPPLYHLAQVFVGSKIKKERIRVFLGARDKSLLLCENDFKKLGIRLDVATDDGSKGKKGFVTGILEDFLKAQGYKKTRIFTCGPTPMLKTVSSISQRFKVPCEVSVEVPMACGFGACLGCAIKVDAGQSHRFAIACCEGPVFQAKDILWE